jgi:HAMP domain-containing protein
MGVRGPVYLTAGILHFPYRRFLITDLVCATIVVSLFYGLAWYFGPDIISYISRAERDATIVVAILVVAAVVLFFVHRRRSKRLARSLETLEHASDVLAPHHSPEGLPDVPASSEQPSMGQAEERQSADGDGVERPSQERLPQDQ